MATDNTTFHPSRRTRQANVPASAAASDDLNTLVALVPFDGVITEITLVPASTITGANTNYRTVYLWNRTQNKLLGNYAFTSGNNATSKTAKTIPLTSTVADRTVAKGDVLEWVSQHAASGIADPGGLVLCTFGRGTE